MAAIAISAAITVGGMALQYLLTPKIKQQPVDKGKMDDIRLQGSDYGQFIPRLLSGRARMAGNVVVATPVRHFAVTTGGGGGGGKKNRSAPVTNHIYQTTFGILVSRGPLTSIDRIWADTDLLVANNSAPHLSVATFEAESGAKTGTASNSSSGGVTFGTGLGAGRVTINLSSMVSPLHRNGDDMEAKTRFEFFYKSSVDVTVNIDTIDPTNGAVSHTESFESTGGDWSVGAVIVAGHCTSVAVYNSGIDLDKVNVERFWQSPTGFHVIPYNITGAVNPNIDYPPNTTDPSGYYNYPLSSTQNVTTGTFSFSSAAVPGTAIRLYMGTELQTADSAIQAYIDQRYGSGQGALRTSAMRGIAYVVLQDFTLKGSTTPQFTFEISKSTSTLNEALTTLFADVGLTSGDYDVTATAAKTQAGLLEHTNQSRKALIEAYQRYHQFRLAEVDGKIYTILETDTAAATLTASQLRAHLDTDSMPGHDCMTLIKEEHLLPREVRVSFMNPELEYHNDVAVAQFFAGISGTETKEFSFPIIDTADAARLVAEKLIRKEYNESKAVEWDGMPSTARYAIGDVVNVPINGVNTPVRIEKKQITLPIGPVKFQGMTVGTYTPSYFQADVNSIAPMSIAQQVQSDFPRNSIAFAIPSIPIRDADRGRVGIYLAVAGIGRGRGERIALYREMSDDNYVPQDFIDTPSVLGLCEDTLGNHAGGITTEDTSNVLDIWFFDDVTLETVTTTDINRLPLINLIRVGNEWLQFRTATAQALEDNSPYGSKWRISNLWRGRFGTAAAISTHASGEYAAVVTPALKFFDLEPEDIGQTVNLKAVTAGQDIDNAPTTSFIFTSSEIVHAEARESMTAGMMVNVALISGTYGVRKANATDNTKPCNGYILRSVDTTWDRDTVSVHTEWGSVIPNLSGLTAGATYYLSTTGGGITTTPPSGSGNIVQKVGTAISTTALLWQPEIFFKKR